MFCKNCGREIPDNVTFCGICGAPLKTDATAPSGGGMDFDFNSNTVSSASSVRYEYKVLSQKDKWFSGKFDPMRLEQAMNAYAEQGWRVIGCATADIAGFGSTRQEFVTVLERAKQG